MSVKKINYTLIGTASIRLDDEDTLQDIQSLVCDREDRKLETTLIKGINWELTELRLAGDDDEEVDINSEDDYDELDFED